MKTFRTSSAIVTLAALFVFCPAIAVDAHQAAKHGGILIESGHHHLEIVAKDGIVEVHVTGEDGQPEDVKDAKASAAVLSEGKKIDIALAPDAANVLKGTGVFKAVKGTTVVVTLTMPGHQPEQSRIKLD